ncbi:MAG: hypothetical protein MI922_09675, partial [Bacteroidales bacterium]|nr:hypothetical protein [Bacteroidales bacterium]
EKYQNIGIIAEFFADEQTMLNTGPRWCLNLNLATPWDYKFVPQLREYLKYIHRVSLQIRYYMPITSHDSGTPTQEFGSADSTIPRYVASALMGTGATGIIQGVEWGEEKKIDFIGHRPKIDPPVEPVYETFLTKVNTILERNPAFRRGGNCKFVDHGHDAIIAAFRKSYSNNILGYLVACNFDIGSEQHVHVDLHKYICTDDGVRYVELLSDKTGVYDNLHIDISLPPNSAKVIMLVPKNQNISGGK